MPKQILLFVCLIGMLFSHQAFAGGNVAIEEGQAVAAELSLEETCLKLSEDNEYEYEAVYAKNALFDYYPRHLCPRPENCQKGQASVYAHMKPIPPFSVDGDEWISVYTKLVPEKEYWDLPIPRYFKGKYNKFCARKISEQEFIDAGFEPEPNKYKIEHLETIQSHLLPLEETCRKLSEDSEYEYHVVSGTAIKSGITPPWPIECLSNDPDCRFRLSRGWYYAVIENDDGIFSIYTKADNRNDLIKKPLPILKGEKYSFCAREPEITEDGIILRIDHLETIQRYPPNK